MIGSIGALGMLALFAAVILADMALQNHWLDDHPGAKRWGRILAVWAAAALAVALCCMVLGVVA